MGHLLYTILLEVTECYVLVYENIYILIACPLLFHTVQLVGSILHIRQKIPFSSYFFLYFVVSKHIKQKIIGCGPYTRVIIV